MRPTLIAKPQQAVFDGGADHFAAAWHEGESPGEAWFTLGRQRIGVAIGQAAIPRLRVDRVALRLVRRLQEALGDAVPDGSLLIVTITAPIRRAAKTAAALEEEIQPLLARRPSRSKAQAEACHTIHGNRIRVRLVKGRVVKAPAGSAAKVIGFVHNPAPDSGSLLDLAHCVIERIGGAAAAKRRASE